MKTTTQSTKWPFLQKMLEKKAIAYIHLCAAEQLTDNEAVTAFLCHLFASSHEGHLCISIDDLKIEPSPQDIWISREQESQPLSGNDLDQLNELIRNGAIQLPANLVTVFDKHTDNFPFTPICRKNHFYYLQRNWINESQFYQQLHRFKNDSPTLKIDLTAGLQSRLAEQKLLPEQAEAIRNCTDNCLSILTGGPGTGKTYTAGQLVSLFWEGLEEKQKKHFHLTLTAPTGKAVANLEASLNRSLIGLPPENISVKTLHSLLEINSMRHQKMGSDHVVILGADLILVDECSMVDAEIMAKLFAAVKPGARIVLLGDPHQLPPVQSGNLFADLVRHSGSELCRELTVCMRSELKAILQFAEAVKHGNSAKAIDLLNIKQEGVEFREQVEGAETIATRHKALLEYVEQHFIVDFTLNAVDILKAFNKFRLLSPLRQGPFGVDELNRLFVNRIIQKIRNNLFIAPIMIAHNDYRLDIFNGDVGILIREKNEEYAFFPEQSGIRKISSLLLPKYEYAYCLSVHKSQGSEFDHVLLVIPQGSEHFGREVLYTAATRAKKKLEIWGDPATLTRTIHNPSQRLSGINSEIY